MAEKKKAAAKSNAVTRIGVIVVYQGGFPMTETDGILHLIVGTKNPSIKLYYNTSSARAAIRRTMREDGDELTDYTIVPVVG